MFEYCWVCTASLVVMDTCRLQCPFIDIPSSMMLDDGRRFNDDQIDLAMHDLIQSIQHRSSFVKPWHIAESIEPDIRCVII